MIDAEARELLRLLHKYVEEYGDSDTTNSIADLAEDLAMSLDVTTDEDDRMRREICIALVFGSDTRCSRRV